MAAPDDIEVRGTDLPDGEIDTIREQLNNVIASFRLLTAKLDVLTAKLNADAGVTDTDYDEDFDSTLTDSGVATAPAQITRTIG